jgi:hypothetical protein
MSSKEDLEKMMRTPVDISTLPLEERANILTLHFIGYLAKPNGINEKVYNNCMEAFSSKRGKVEWETEAVLNILKNYPST